MLLKASNTWKSLFPSSYCQKSGASRLGLFLTYSYIFHIVTYFTGLLRFLPHPFCCTATVWGLSSWMQAVGHHHYSLSDRARGIKFSSNHTVNNSAEILTKVLILNPCLLYRSYCLLTPVSFALFSTWTHFLFPDCYPFPSWNIWYFISIVLRL